MSPIVRKPPIVFRSSRKSSDATVNFVDFETFSHRLKKTLHYGRLPTTDRPSLPMTELAVEFFSKAVPDGLGRIDLDYTSSVSRNACISPCSMILAMAYIERLRHRSPEYIQKVSSSDLFLVSMMVASKFLYDDGEDEAVFNDEWAASADVDVDEINQLEINFLGAIDWCLYVDPMTFDNLLKQTEFQLSLRKVRDRGWATYTEMEVLMDGGLIVSTCHKIIMEYVIKVVAVSSVAYLASVITLIGATLIVNETRQFNLTPLKVQPEVTTISSLSSNMSITSNDSLELIGINFDEYPHQSATSSFSPSISSSQVPAHFGHLRYFVMRPNVANWSLQTNFHPKSFFLDICI